jgi:hypothetical protein
MKLKFKENPREWCKQALLTALGLAIFSSLLRWRHLLATPSWLIVLGVLVGLAIGSLMKPRWFRGYYRFSMRLGFALSQFIGRAVLLIMFFVIVTPMAWLLRVLGKDSLQRKRHRDDTTYWHPSKPSGSLDRLF